MRKCHPRHTVFRSKWCVISALQTLQGLVINVINLASLRASGLCAILRKHPRCLFEVIHPRVLYAQIAKQFRHLNWFLIIALEVNALQYQILNTRLGAMHLVRFVQILPLFLGQEPVLFSLYIVLLFHLSPHLLHNQLMLIVDRCHRHNPKAPVA